MSRRTLSHRGETFEVEARLDGDELRAHVGAGAESRWRVRNVGPAEFIAVETGAETERQSRLFALRDRSGWWIHLDGRSYFLEAVIERGAGAPAGGLAAPIPATVSEVLVADGDEVEEGQVLLVLSAMKMQIEIRAPHAGVISGLGLRADDQVDGGQQLLTVINHPDAGEAP